MGALDADSPAQRRGNLDETVPRALSAISKWMERGADTPGEDWRSRPIEFHVARALCGLASLAKGAAIHPTLEIAATRLVMALELFRARYSK